MYKSMSRCILSIVRKMERPSHEGVQRSRAFPTRTFPNTRACGRYLTGKDSGAANRLAEGEPLFAPLPFDHLPGLSSGASSGEGPMGFVLDWSVARRRTAIVVTVLAILSAMSWLADGPTARAAFPGGRGKIMFGGEDGLHVIN